MLGPLRIGSLFSGVGGLELGLEWADLGHIVFQVEWDPFCQSILAARWPDVPRFGNITTIHAADLPECDALVGGFPCQDVSKAGAGAGLGGARSGLFYHIARLIREFAAIGRPIRIVVLENVSAILGRGLDDVLATLAACGYDAEWDCIPADAVGAPHERDRWFLVAYPNSDRDGCRPRRRIFQTSGEGNPDGGRLSGSGPRQLRLDATQAGQHEAHPDADGEGLGGAEERLGRQPALAGFREVFPCGEAERERERESSLSDSNEPRLAQREGQPHDDGAQQPAPERGRGDGPQGGQEWATPIARLGGGAHGATRWLDGSWEDGIPRVTEQTKLRKRRVAAIGNAVVPQVAAYVAERIKQAWRD